MAFLRLVSLTQGNKLDWRVAWYLVGISVLSGLFLLSNIELHPAVHSLLEWTSFILAIYVAVASYTYYFATKKIAIPVIGTTILFTGVLDAFDLLLNDNTVPLMSSVVNVHDFSWLMSRCFSSLGLIFASALILRKNHKSQTNFSLLLMVFLACLLVSTFLMIFCLYSDSIPQIVYSENLLSRPFEFIPLGLYLVAAFYFLPRLHNKLNDLFSHALLLSVIPLIAAELYMILASHSMTDNAAMIAHILKVCAHIVPLCGLGLDYVRTYSNEIQSKSVIEETLRELEKLSESSFKNIDKNMQEINEAVKELVQSTRQINHSAGKASSMTEGTLAESEEAESLIVELYRGNEKIEGILEVVNSITVQTRLLALNAAIEAAKAGESGKGFSVVAGEVKELSNQTKLATENIAGILNNIQEQLQEALGSITKTTSSVRSVNKISSQIAKSLSEHNDFSENVAKNVLDVSQNLANLSNYIKQIHDNLVARS